MKNIDFIFVIVLVELASGLFCECPGEDIVEPCICSSKNGTDQILCDLVSLDLKQYFTGLSNKLGKHDKHFGSLLVKRLILDHLEANTFSDITFDSIRFDDNNIKTVDQDAFHGTDQVTSYLRFARSAIISPDGAIFKELSKFKNLEILELVSINIKVIPTSAFEYEQGELFKFEVNGNGLEKVESRAFSKLTGLSMLNFLWTDLADIPDEAFAFDKQSEDVLKLNFFGNSKLNGSGFAPRSLAGMQRPAEITFDSVDMVYLDEKVFKTFLDGNKLNKINLFECQLDCKDDRNDWLKDVNLSRLSPNHCKSSPGGSTINKLNILLIITIVIITLLYHK